MTGSKVTVATSTFLQHHYRNSSVTADASGEMSPNGCNWKGYEKIVQFQII